MLSLFSFGKKKRSHKRSHVKGSKKPSAKVMRMCKKYKIKATKKVGKKRVYKPQGKLLKMCMRKKRLLAKKKKHSVRRRRSGFGSGCGAMYGSGATGFGMRRLPSGGFAMGGRSMSAFGKKRRVVHKKKPVSRAAAMKAFKKFYRLHCRATSRRSRFGAGNPMLSMSMGGEFCPNGGGVLESSGLYPSPCASSAFGRRR